LFNGELLARQILGRNRVPSTGVLDLWTNGAFMEATKLIEKMARAILSEDSEMQTRKPGILVTK
jgi:hypothetical protein